MLWTHPPKLSITKTRREVSQSIGTHITLTHAHTHGFFGSEDWVLGERSSTFTATVLPPKLSTSRQPISYHHTHTHTHIHTYIHMHTHTDKDLLGWSCKLNLRQ